MTEKTVDKHFSKYIRLRDAKFSGDSMLIGNCCTCNKQVKIWELGGGYNAQSHCGHFQSRRHKSTRFDEKNCSLQCSYCNTYNQGMQFEFGKYIDKRWGEGTADLLSYKARQLTKRNRYDFEILSKEYREKVKELETKFGIR